MARSDEIVRQESGEHRIGEEGDGANTSQSKGERRGVRGLLPSGRAREWGWYSVIVLLALGLNFYQLGAPSIWFDEAFSVELARQPLSLVWRIIWGPEPNMELYYVFLHGWLVLMGWLGLNPTEVVVRLPSAVFAALGAGMVYLLGKRFLGTVVGIVGGALYALNDLQLIYAQQTRAYSLQVFLLCLSWYALLMALVGGQVEADGERKNGRAGKWWWGCYIVASVLAVYTHLFSLLILLTQVVGYVGLMWLAGPWRGEARRQWKTFAGSLVCIGVLSVPMLLVSLHGSKTGWLPVPHLHDMTHLFLMMTGNSKLYLLLVGGCVGLGLLTGLLVYTRGGGELLGLYAVGKTGRREQRSRDLQKLLPMGLLLLCWLTLPVLLTYLISQGSTRLFSTRYLVVIVPALCLLVGMGVAALRWRMAQGVLALLLIGVAFLYVPVYYRSAQVEDWNRAAPWLQQQYQAKDGIVCYDNDVEQGCQIAMEYYLHAYPGAAHFTGDQPGAYSWKNFGPANPQSGTEAAVDPGALATYAKQHTRMFFIIARLPDNAAAARAKAAREWLSGHYRLLRNFHTPTVDMYLYQTT